MDTLSNLKINKVQKRSAEAQATDLLRESIVTGDLPPGTRITEIKIAEMLAVARATMRTAFHHLAQEGLLIQTPYTGWAVMTLSSNDAWELYTLRASLEALAARLVAQQVKEGTAATSINNALDATLKRLERACEAGDRKEIADADFALHKTIIQLSKHSRLLEQYSRVEHQIRIYIASSDALIFKSGEILAQHQPIVAAIKDGNLEGAVQALTTHIEHEGTILVRHLRDLEQDTSH